MKHYLVCLFFILNGIVLSQEVKEYKLLYKKELSDIRYRLFKKYDDFHIYRRDKLKKSFIPQKGKYDVYVFICKFLGDSFTGEQKYFHDYLILKVDPKNQFVLDGFHYTMEWAEPPAITDLYRVSAKGVKIKNRLNLDLLQMKIEDNYALREEYLSDQGILIIQ